MGGGGGENSIIRGDACYIRKYGAGHKKKSPPKPQGADRKNALRGMVAMVIKPDFLPQHIEKSPLRCIHKHCLFIIAHILKITRGFRFFDKKF
jgi:hypothetical protein